MEKTVKLKIYKEKIEGTYPAVCWFAIDCDNYGQQADYLLGDLIDIMQRMNREPLDKIFPGNYQQSTMALFKYLYDEESCADIVEFLNTIETNKFDFNHRIFRAFKDFNSLRIPERSVYYYRLKEGLGAAATDRVQTLSDYLIASYGEETGRHYTYQCHSIRDVILALLEYLAEEDYSIATCERCGRLYSPVNKSSEKYCRRLYGNRECRKTAFVEAQSVRINKDILGSEYRKKIVNLNRRIDGGFSTSDWCKSQKKLLKDGYSMRLERLAAGNITESEVLEWLVNFETKAPKEGKQ